MVDPSDTAPSPRICFAVCLLLLIGVHVATRVAVWQADPDWNRSLDLSVEVDGGQYATRAINAAQGLEQPPAMFEHYDVPLHSWLLRAGFSLRFGLVGARIPGIALGLLLVVFASGLAWTLSGPRAAFVSGLLLLSLPGQFDLDLAMSPYSLISAGVTGSMLLVAIASRREHVWEIVLLGLAALVLLLSTATIRTVGLIALPGVAAGFGVALARQASPRARRALGLLAAGLVVLGALTVLGHPGLRAEATKHMGSISVETAFGHWLRFGQQFGSVTFALGVFGIWTLALLRQLRSLVTREAGWNSSSLPVTVAMHLLILTTLGYLSLLDYRPPRYWTFLFPMLAVVVGAFLVDLFEGRATVRPWPPAGGVRWQRMAAFALHTLVLLWIVHQAVFSLFLGLRFLGAPLAVVELRNGLLHVLADLVVLVAFLVVAWRPPGDSSESVGKRSAAALLAGTLALNLAFLTHSMAFQTRALPREGELLGVVLPADAKLAGPLGPTIALLARRTAVSQFRDGEKDTGFGARLRECGATHVVIDDEHLPLLAELRGELLEVRAAPYRGFDYHLLRVRETLKAVPPTAGERASIAHRAGKTAEAIGELEALLEGDPDVAGASQLKALLAGWKASGK